MRFTEDAQVKGGSMDETPAATLGAQSGALISGDHALAVALGVSLSTVRTWRRKRLIPFIKTGHKSLTYQLFDVIAALRSLRVRPITEKGGR